MLAIIISGPVREVRDVRRAFDRNFLFDLGTALYAYLLGLDELSRQEILKDAPVGQIYNQRLFDGFLEKHASTLKFHDDSYHVTKRLDERAGTVEITLDSHPCPVD